MSSTKKQADYVMVGVFGLLVVCSGLTIWFHSRYQQAASAVEAALAKGIRIENGKVVSVATEPQIIADARLRTFLIMGVLTGICAIALVIIVLWHRKQRLTVAADDQEPADG